MAMSCALWQVAVDVAAVDQRMVHADRADAGAVEHVHLGVGVAHAVAHVLLLGVQLQRVAGGNPEAHALAGLQQVTGGDAFGLDAKGLELFLQVIERGFVEHLVAKEVQPGLVGLAQDDAVVVALVAGLEIGAALGIAAHGLQAHHVGVPLDRFFQVEYADLGVPRAQNASHCHSRSPSLGFRWGGWIRWPPR